jgi:hypothetical protein
MTSGYMEERGENIHLSGEDRGAENVPSFVLKKRGQCLGYEGVYFLSNQCCGAAFCDEAETPHAVKKIC